MLFRSEQEDAAKRLMKAENLMAESLGIDIFSQNSVLQGVFLFINVPRGTFPNRGN